jgi:hypothetical protein
MATLQIIDLHVSIDVDGHTYSGMVDGKLREHRLVGDTP